MKHLDSQLGYIMYLKLEYCSLEQSGIATCIDTN